ncbi:MAG: hypothetical protein KJ737_27545 [Proteobacteria bacterium]|nr:hypothetical protein [Pseudomonadota bacterium]
MKKQLWSGIWFIACSILLSTNALADMFDTYGFGARGTAMGGAACASAAGASSVYYNLAGLGKVTGFEEDISYFRTYTSLDLKLSDPDPPENMPKDNDLSFGAISVGLAVNLNKIINLPWNMTFGFGLGFMDDLSVSALEDLEESEYAFVRFGAPLKLVTTYFGIGSEIIKDTFWIGVGARAMI